MASDAYRAQPREADLAGRRFARLDAGPRAAGDLKGSR
jgi:hypothetical protein